MKLQNIIFPSVKTCMEEELYFRKNDIEKFDFNFESNTMCLEKGAKVSFDTYFNGFSIGKWLKYTRVNNVTLRLKLKGKYNLSLLYKEERAIDKIMTQVVHVLTCDTKGEVKEISIPVDCGKGIGMYSFSCTALNDKCQIYGGAWCTDIDQDEKVKIAIIICTFRREEYIRKNLEILRDTFLGNENLDLKDKLIVYISDNGRSLEPERFNSEHVRVFPNKNAGGAGGFARGLIEAMKWEEERGITHVLLMDDDVIIQPEAIYRTYAIWSLIRPEYKESFIGGAMLKLDEPWIQSEAGAFWNAGRLQSRKTGMDLRKLKACLQNEVEEGYEYNAWWYCSFSMKHVKKDNLPLPIFIRGDDVEFGLRNMKHLILLNGICVWHEAFENKYSSMIYYYVFRNRLICNSIQGIRYTKQMFWREFHKWIIQELFTYRYENVELLLAGINDFLKGIDWLMDQDGEALNQSIMERGYRLVDTCTLDVPFDLNNYQEKKNSIESKTHRLWRRCIINGIFLRSKQDNENAIVPTINPNIYWFYKKKRALHYDYSSKKGFVTAKDNRRFCSLLRELWTLKRHFNKNYSQRKNEYKLRGNELMHISFWEKYLETKQCD